ncbi:hypothetical protein PIB30_096345 [Stylosanthes scabra]|uniref:RRM domain-containing protein n=1 Tax=Stylosanthes scabra TaxID=79078 RepID=A0ABU6RWE5_9FABA|nr:hypothetical protein [Stylosanthes scabra]
MGYTVRAPGMPEEEIRRREGVGLYQVLRAEVTKRALYKEFRKDGYIRDVFISRKTRKKTMCLFAFVRYSSYGGALRAITRLNGTLWGKFKLYVTLSKFKRETNQSKVMHADQKQMKIQKWMVVKKINSEVEKCKEPEKENLKMVVDQRKVIEATWAEDQRQRLHKSLLGVSVRPIEFRKVMEHLLEEWKGPGEIECRDIGPYKCLITFDSPEIRDEAF